MLSFKIFIFISVLTKLCVCHNILVLIATIGRSHFDVFAPLFKELVQKRGHKLTLISPFSLEINSSNLRFLMWDDFETAIPLDLPFYSENRWELYSGAPQLHSCVSTFCRIGLSNPAFQNILKSNEKFDVVITEFFNTNCFMSVVKKLDAPLIGLSSSPVLPWTNSFVANPEHPAYIPVMFMDYSNKMTFFERVENTVVLQANKLYYNYVMATYGNELSVKYTGVDVLTPRDAMYNTSLILVNTHFSLHGARPLVPGIVEVGGIHIGGQKKLPTDIEKWLNESPEGVIYFSLGSMIKGHTFPEEKRQAFLKAFARLPQRVLWKWENDTMKGKPDNVMIQKWMPQFDILCHPNVKAFISHGGLLGTTESVHCGVPMLVMPQFGDQHTNARAVEASGGGVILYLSQATEESIYNKLQTILHPKFGQQAKDLSERFRDRPLSPLDTAIYWIEYVARHKGAPHMRTAAVDMPFYQYYLLDVFAFLLAVLFAIVYVSYRIVKIILSVLLGSKDKGSKKGGSRKPKEKRN